jgi:hypothetical protein
MSPTDVHQGKSIGNPLKERTTWASCRHYSEKICETHIIRSSGLPLINQSRVAGANIIVANKYTIDYAGKQNAYLSLHKYLCWMPCIHYDSCNCLQVLMQQVSQAFIQRTINGSLYVSIRVELQDIFASKLPKLYTFKFRICWQTDSYHRWKMHS